MAEAAETNWLDVLRAALWPTLALIALILLQGPAIKILTKVSEFGAQEIEAGSRQNHLLARRSAPRPTS